MPAFIYMQLVAPKKIVWVGAVLLCAIVVTLVIKPAPNIVEIKNQIDLPLIIGANASHSNQLISHGVAAKIKIEMVADGPTTLIVDGKKKKCRPGVCTFVVKPKPPLSELRITSSQSTTIDTFNLTVVKYKSVTRMFFCYLFETF